MNTKQEIELLQKQIIALMDRVQKLEMNNRRNARALQEAEKLIPIGMRF